MAQKVQRYAICNMQYVISNSFLTEILVCKAEYKTYAWSNDWHVYPKNCKAGSKKSFYILSEWPWMVKNYVACHSLRPQLELNLCSLEHLTKIFLEIFSRLTHISVMLRWFPAIIHNIIICLKRRKDLCKIHLAHICKNLIIFYGWLILCYLPSSLSDLSMTRLTNSSALSASMSAIWNFELFLLGRTPG